MKKTNTFRWTISGLLIAIGIVIPIFSPVKVLLEPASFTLAGHVQIIFAMFLSPAMAIYVSLGTTVGFFLAGFPIVVSLRALSHVVFAGVGAIVLKKYPNLIGNVRKSLLFSFFIGLIHAAAEVFIVAFFYYGGGLPEANYTRGFFYSIFLLVGVGTIIHSMIDFALAQTVWNGLGQRSKKLKKSIL